DILRRDHGGHHSGNRKEREEFACTIKFIPPPAGNRLPSPNIPRRGILISFAVSSCGSGSVPSERLCARSTWPWIASLRLRPCCRNENAGPAPAAVRLFPPARPD